jgi:hypothetical protein
VVARSFQPEPRAEDGLIAEEGLAGAQRGVGALAPPHSAAEFPDPETPRWTGAVSNGRLKTGLTLVRRPVFARRSAVSFA